MFRPCIAHLHYRQALNTRYSDARSKIPTGSSRELCALKNGRLGQRELVAQPATQRTNGSSGRFLFLGKGSARSVREARARYHAQGRPKERSHVADNLARSSHAHLLMDASVTLFTLACPKVGGERVSFRK